MKRLSAFFAGAVTMLSAAAAQACSCAYMEITIDQILADGAVAAQGVAVRIDPASETIDDSGSNFWPEGLEPVRYRFEVHKSLGQPLPEEITVQTAPNSAMCGVMLPEGQEVIVMLDSDGEGDYGVNLCGQLLIDSLQEDWEAAFRAIGE